MGIKFSVVLSCEECSATAVGTMDAGTEYRSEVACSDGCCYTETSEYRLDPSSLRGPEGWRALVDGTLCPEHHAAFKARNNLR